MVQLSLRRRFTAAFFVFAAVLYAACTPAPASPEPDLEQTEEASGSEAGEAIVIADISDDPANTIEEIQPLADYLAEHLGDYGITRGEVVVVADTDEMAEKLASGEVDLFFDSVYPATIVSDASGAVPFIRRWKDGVEEYHTVIFANPEAGVETLEDLPGHMIAFDEPSSTSGFVLPYVYLLEQGLTLVEKESPEDEVGEDEVGYVFSEDDDNTLQWVTSGLVAAGATDDIGYEEDIPADVRENFVILAETESLPRQVGVITPDIDPDLRAAIEEVLMGMDEDPDAAVALEEFDDTAQFDEFPEGSDAAFERMRELIEIASAAGDQD